MSSVDIDVSLDSFVDLTKTIKCTALSGCSNEASFRMTHNSPCLIFYCREHAMKMLIKFQMFEYFACGHCGRVKIPRKECTIIPI